MDLELQLAKPLKICKTLVLPVDKRITRTKVKFLDKLTARLTYGVQLFLEKIIAENITGVKEAKTKVFLHGTGGAVDHPELSMSGFLLSLVEKAQQSVRAEAT
jgi:hypothetical protein